MNTKVFDVVHLFSEQGISSVPIIDDEGIVINLYETVDVIVSIYTPLLSRYRRNVWRRSPPDRSFSLYRHSFDSEYTKTSILRSLPR